MSSADDDLTFLCDIITSDDTWCFSYDPQTMPKFENTSIPTADVMLPGLVSRKDDAGGLC